MTSDRPHAARIAAKLLLANLWKQRRAFFPGGVSVGDFLKAAPEVIVRDYLKISLEYRVLQPSNPTMRIAGFIDRSKRLIVVATEFKPAWQRFTLAHEIGHWMLHPGETYFRERPMTGDLLADVHRPPVEVEADLFAAELLMPPKNLRESFAARFGGPIDGRSIDVELSQSLSDAIKRKVDAVELTLKSPLERAKLIAQSSVYRGIHFKSLVEQFGVSPTAMGIQLLETELVF